MFTFFTSITDFFNAAWTFVSNMVSSMLNAFTLIQSTILFTAELPAYLPGILGASVSIVVALGLLKLVLGWGNA